MFTIRVTSLLLFLGLDDLNDLVHHRRIRQSRSITQRVFLAAQDFSENSSHDLARSGLWQIIDNENCLNNVSEALGQKYVK